MVIAVIVLGIAGGIASVLAAAIAGMPLWLIALSYPMGGTLAVALLIAAMAILPQRDGVGRLSALEPETN